MERPVVLIGEDDPSVRFTIEFVLEDAGFEVVMAEDGEKALGLARDLIPQAILLDNSMPKMTGKEVFEALKADPSTRDIPVFLLSGMARPGPEWQGAHVVGKPFSPDDLVEAITKALEERSD